MAARSTTPARKTTTTKASASPKRRVVKPKITETVQVNAYIPDVSVAEKYIGRKVWGIWDKKIADIAIANMQNILLLGDTGSGKTMFGEAYAAATGRMYYSLPCDVSVDPSALFGRTQPTETPGSYRWQDGPVTQIVRFGGVLNISEINFMPPKIAASLYPLLDSRRYIPLIGHEGEVVRAHPDLLVIADMNPNYRGTMELNAAFRNRFDFKIPWGYDATVEEQLVKYPTLRDIAGRLRALSGDEIMTPVSTNMLMEFEAFASNKELSLEFATMNFVSAFEVDEQEAVNKIFELNKSKLEQDISYFSKSKGRKSSQIDDGDLEELDFEYEEE